MPWISHARAEWFCAFDGLLKNGQRIYNIPALTDTVKRIYIFGHNAIRLRLLFKIRLMVAETGCSNGKLFSHKHFKDEHRLVGVQA